MSSTTRGDGTALHTPSESHSPDYLRLQEAWRGDRPWYENVLALMPAGLYIVEAETGTITYFNEQAARIWGRPARLGALEERFCGCYKVYMPDGTFVPREQTPMAVAIREGRSFRNVEAIVERPDGSRITALVNIEPLRDASGKVTGAVNVFYDITDRRHAEKSLRDSEERLRVIVDATLECIKVVAADGTLLQMNNSGLEMIGAQSAEGVLGQCVYDLIAPEDRERFREFNERVCRGESGALEFDILGLAGRRRHLDTRAVPLRQPDGAYAQLAVTRDITAQHDAARELALSEERYRAVVESQSEMVCRFRPDGSILFANGAYARSCGCTPEQMREQNFWNFIPVADRDQVRAMLEALSPESPVVRIENRFVTTEGERWTLWTNRALRFDAEGRLVEAQSTGIDITDRKQAEQALAHEQEKLRLLADTIPQLAWMARPDGHVFWYNKRWYEYTGTAPADMEGWGWQSVHDPSVLPEVLARWKRSIASGEAFDMVFPVRGADSVFRNFLTRVNPLRDEQGRVLYWFGTNTDVSEIKRMEEALRESDRRKDEFLAVLSHELRNPLAPIKNIVALLRTNGADASMLEQVLPVLERQVGHLIRLVDDLLDVARINRGDIVLQKRATSLAEIVSAGLETSRPLIDARRHHLEVKLTNAADSIVGDPVRLAQVVANVLNNAATYTGPGGNLEVSTRSVENFAELRVRDNGVGIPPETMKTIFDLFKRGDNAREHPSGFGIGLALARRLVEMHDGTIGVHSDGPNLGSEFVIRLPIERVEHKLVDSAVGHENLGAGKRILVVDDNIDVARSLAMLLEAIGADVCVAGDGPSALRAFATEQPAVVILDIGMPGMSGHDVAREIRTRYPDTRAVLVAHTGWGQEDDRRTAAEAGFEFHLVKPADLSALQEILAKAPAGR